MNIENGCSVHIFQITNVIIMFIIFQYLCVINEQKGEKRSITIRNLRSLFDNRTCRGH